MDIFGGQKGLETKMPGKIKWGRPKRKYLEVVKEDMQEVGVREDEVFQCTENPL